MTDDTAPAEFEKSVFCEDLRYYKLEDDDNFNAIKKPGGISRPWLMKMEYTLR